jgi:metal-responsive CopG/Arc/MetJ family transcriptional regulator
MTEQMSKQNKARCTMSISQEIIDEIDNHIEAAVFSSRSHAAERALKQMLKQLREKQ